MWEGLSQGWPLLHLQFVCLLSDGEEMRAAVGLLCAVPVSLDRMPRWTDLWEIIPLGFPRGCVVLVRQENVIPEQNTAVHLHCDDNSMVLLDSLSRGLDTNDSIWLITYFYLSSLPNGKLEQIPCNMIEQTASVTVRATTLNAPALECYSRTSSSYSAMIVKTLWRY